MRGGVHPALGSGKLAAVDILSTALNHATAVDAWKGFTPITRLPVARSAEGLQTGCYEG